jgi:hypothetical protein
MIAAVYMQSEFDVVVFCVAMVADRHNKSSAIILSPKVCCHSNIACLL